MRKLAVITMLGVCLAGACAGAAQADPATNSQNNLELKLGVFQAHGNEFDVNQPLPASFINPVDQISVGAEYEVFPKHSQNGLGSAYSLSVDYMQVQRDFFVSQSIFSNTATQTAIPVLVNYKYYWQAGQNTKGYAGVGVGGVLGDYSGFGYSGFIGLEPGNNFDIEMRYIGTGSSSNVQGSTLSNLFGIDVGWHFR